MLFGKETGADLSEAMEADGKLEVGNWALQLLHKRPWLEKTIVNYRTLEIDQD